MDIIEPRRSDMEKLYPSLKGVPLAHLRSRFGVLKMLNQMVAAIIIPVVNLWSMKDWSLGSLLRNCKNILFLEAKMAILTQSLQVPILRLRLLESDPLILRFAAHVLEREGPAKRDSQSSRGGKRACQYTRPPLALRTALQPTPSR